MLYSTTQSEYYKTFMRNNQPWCKRVSKNPSHWVSREYMTLNYHIYEGAGSLVAASK